MRLESLRSLGPTCPNRFYLMSDLGWIDLSQFDHGPKGTTNCSFSRTETVISTTQIVAAGILTGIAVAFAAAVVRWDLPWLITAALGALILIIVWRLVCNLLNLNGDFIPAISVGDVVCLLVGALAPLAVALWGRVPTERRWIPAFVAGIVAFVANVVIL